MQQFRLLAVISIAVIIAACGGGTEKNNTQNNTTQNNTTQNNTTQNNTTDACAGTSCPALDANCVGTIAVTYSGAGTCSPATGTCNYDAVETRTDCATTNQSCSMGACVDIGDLCADVTCGSPPVGPMCDGDTAVSFGAGTCDPATGMCDFTNAEVRTDCTATSQICSQGSCVDATPAPNPGDLAVTEVMANPAAVADSSGEWFEIFNASTRDIDLNGLTIKDDGSDMFAIPASTPMLAAGEYLVFGINGDTATNGGVDVDIVYTGITLANGDDELVIVDANMVEIDRVAWGAGWTIPNGPSLQFGSNNNINTDDNNDPQFWCGASAPYGDGDLGTPGGSNGTCEPTTTTLYALSDETDPNHVPAFSVVAVSAVAITALDATKGYMWLQETAGGEYSGIYVDTGGVDLTGLAVGDVVDIVGSYDEYFGDLARITASSITSTGATMTIAPEVLETSVLADPAMAEAWENVLVQINEAGVTDIGLGNGEILIDSNILVDDLLFADFSANAAECEVYATITGPLNFSFGAFKIEPRDANDIGTAVTAMSTTSVSQAAFAFDPAAICITAGDTVTWTNTEAVAHTVTERLASQDSALDANIPTTPAFDEMLPANGTAMVTFAEAGTFHYRCRPHSQMEGVVVVPDP